MFMQINAVFVNYSFSEMFHLMFFQFVYLFENIKLIRIMFIKSCSEIKFLVTVLREIMGNCGILGLILTTNIRNYVVNTNIFHYIIQYSIYWYQYINKSLINIYEMTYIGHLNRSDVPEYLNFNSTI